MLRAVLFQAIQFSPQIYMDPSISLYNNDSIKHQLFIYTQLNIETVLF